MTHHRRVHHEVAPTWPEQMLEEIIRQLPLGLICTDLEGEVLFMNAAAQELLACEIPVGASEHHGRAPRLPELPVEIRRGIDYFSGLLAQPQSRYTKPFPKLSVQNHAGYDIEFFLYCTHDEVTRDTREQA
jgi:PAS domain-containing protein